MFVGFQCSENLSGMGVVAGRHHNRVDIRIIKNFLGFRCRPGKSEFSPKVNSADSAGTDDRT